MRLLPRIGRRGQVLKLHSTEAHAAEPGLILVTIHYERPKKHDGRFAVMAELHWTTGKAHASAQIDVPGGGACVAVAGADGLEVSVEGEGDPEARSVNVRVEAQSSWVEAPHPRPARRTVVVRKDALTKPHAIPAFARAVRLMWPDGTAGELVFLTRMSLGAVLTTIPAATRADVPQGAEAFALKLTPSPAYDVHTLWELSL